MTGGWTTRINGGEESGKMTRAQTLHHAAQVMDKVGERAVDEYFEEFEYDPKIEAALRHKLRRWKAEQLRKVHQLLCCAEAGAESEDSVH